VRLVRSKSFLLKPMAYAAGFLLTAAGPALATNLDLSVQSGGSNVVTVLPGANVPYSVMGELGDAASDGLAAFSIDLSFSGGPLAAADAPSGPPMVSFNRPLGLTNPAGFGGTVVAGLLVQVGGAQNTIKNVFAPYPNGSVVTGVAQLGQPLALVTGHLTAPVAQGTYRLVPSRMGANVIQPGQTGMPFWRVDKALPGTITPLTVIVSSLKPRK
jgi:hypothetical protein